MHRHGTHTPYRECMLLTYCSRSWPSMIYFLCFVSRTIFTTERCKPVDFFRGLCMPSTVRCVCACWTHRRPVFSFVFRYVVRPSSVWASVRVYAFSQYAYFLVDLSVRFCSTRTHGPSLDCVSHIRTHAHFLFRFHTQAYVCCVYYTFFGNALHRCNCEHR